MKKTFVTAMVAMSVAFAAEAQLLRTTVAQGEIEGVLHEGHALYKKIPYAEAPVGELRWKAPVSKSPWEGVYKADEWGARPPQSAQGGNYEGMSEDCLYLSVETPAKSKDERLPVFVMIHGGAFSGGSYVGTQESFVREGIVYVSIEYRLGALGFMVHPDLSKESERGISGNYGLMDQIMALQWIHDNIAAFGGDPDKVTIAGESAGGISVSILCASPLCEGPVPWRHQRERWLFLARGRDARRQHGHLHREGFGTRGRGLPEETEGEEPEEVAQGPLPGHRR